MDNIPPLLVERISKITPLLVERISKNPTRGG